MLLALVLPVGARSASIPPPEPIVGTWQFDGARINVVGSAGVFYGAVVSGSYGGCAERVHPGDVSWKSLSGGGFSYSGKFTWYYTDDCSPAGDGPLTITLSSPDAGVVSSSSPVDSGSFNTAITRIDKPFAWMSLPLFELLIPKKPQRQQFESNPLSKTLQIDPETGEVIIDSYGGSNCTCVDGATLIAYTAMLSAGQEAIKRILGKGASCGSKFSALLRGEMSAAERSLEIAAEGSSRAARAKLAADLRDSVGQRLDLVACFKKAGVSDTVTTPELDAAAEAMESGAIPPELSAALRLAGASPEVADLLRLQFFTAQTKTAKGKFPASLARPRDLKALRRAATALRS